MDEVALLHDSLGGKAVGEDGALSADEVHGAGGEVAAEGHHGAVHFADDLELGLAGSEGIQAGLVNGVVDVGGLADIGDLCGGLGELEALDKVGGLGDKGVAEEVRDLEVVVDVEVGIGDLEADLSVEVALFFEDAVEDSDGVVIGVTVPAPDVVGQGELLCFVYVGEAGL